MCYSIYLSTTSGEDLSALPTERANFSRELGDYDSELFVLLENPHRWFLTREFGGCSCHFRHWAGPDEFLFGPPEDWLPEENDDVAATREAYGVLRAIVLNGHGVDVVTAWSDSTKDDIKDLTVSLDAVGQDSFRFFENHRFRIVP